MSEARSRIGSSTDIIEVTADPSTGSGVVAGIGSLARLTTNGDIYLKHAVGNTAWSLKIKGDGQALYIKSPDGTNWTLTVSNLGILSTT